MTKFDAFPKGMKKGGFFHAIIFLAPKNGNNGFIQEFCAKLLLSRASCNFARKKGCRGFVLSLLFLYILSCCCLIYDHWVMLANWPSCSSMNGGPEREYSFYERWSRWSTKPKLLIKRRAAEKIITTFSFQYEDFLCHQIVTYHTSLVLWYT